MIPLRIALFTIYLLIFSTISYSQVSSKNDVDRTTKWILNALDVDYSKVSSDPDKMSDLLQKDYKIERISKAFSKLQSCRVADKYYHNPIHLVAAEHHLFMRLIAGQSGDLMLSALPKAYYDAKIRMKKAGTLSWLRTTDQPVSPPSIHALKWADLGVVLGLYEYTWRTGKDPSFKGEAKEHLERLKWAEKSAIFSWANRLLDVTKYTRDKDRKCGVKEPQA